MAKTIQRCLNSILEQQVDEVVVVDGFSTDGTSQLLDKFSVVHIYDGGNCLAKARNVGLNSCTGNYVVFVDADQWIPQGFDRRLKAILSTRKIDALFCNEAWVGSSIFADAKHEIHSHGSAIRYERVNCPRVYSTSILSAVGGLNDDYIGAEDRELWNRVKRLRPTSYRSKLTLCSDASKLSVKTEFRRGILAGSYVIPYVKRYPSEWEQLSCIPPIGFLSDTLLAMDIAFIKKDIRLGFASLAIRLAHTIGFLFGILRFLRGARTRYEGLQS